MKKDVKKKKSVKTTGYEWDGIKEYDNPEPFWLKVLFYITLFFSLGYWILYPSWPTPNNPGILDWTAREDLKEELAEVQDIRQAYQERFDNASFDEILKDPELLKFALAGGDSAFRNNCAVCHGIGASGSPGYPNLTNGAWLWGGTPEEIYTTIRYGIRSSHENTRLSQMAAFGRDQILTVAEVNILVDYVQSLHKDGVRPDTKGDTLFQKHCASCHGDKGQGDRMFGAPTLNDAVWLYDGDKDTIYDVIYNGREGVMPTWSGKLSDSTIRQLAIYVHQLGGGE